MDGHVHVHARGVFWVGHDAVGDDIRVAVAVLVVFLDDGSLVFLVLLGDEFLGTEEVDDVVVVGLLHRLVDLSVREGLVAGDIDLAYFGLHFLIDDDSHLDVSRVILVG